jgi:hypothetical protein
VQNHESWIANLRKVPAELSSGTSLRDAIATTDYVQRPHAASVKSEAECLGRPHYEDARSMSDSAERWKWDHCSTIPNGISFEADLRGASRNPTVERKQLFIDGKPVGEDME